MPSEVSCKGPLPMAIVSKVVRADAETTGTSLAKLRAKEAEPFGRCEFGREYRH